jgi:voltage-gated potassium channel
MTVITLTTVGYREVQVLDIGGQLFTASLLFFGLGAVFVVLGTLTELVVSGHLSGLLRENQVRRKVDGMTGHHIICAYGRVGRAAAAEFAASGEPFIVLDIDDRLQPAMERDEVVHRIADPTEEAVLRDAGIDRARSLVCAVDSDATNVYITLTARAMNPGLTIIARASRPESVDRLVRAGADRIVQPYALSGSHMAALSLHPSVIDFFDVTHAGTGLRVEEIQVREGSMLDGRLVSEACPSMSGVTPLALRRAAGTILAPPPGDARLGTGDAIVAFGSMSALEALER